MFSTFIHIIVTYITITNTIDKYRRNKLHVYYFISKNMKKLIQIFLFFFRMQTNSKGMYMGKTLTKQQS